MNVPNSLPESVPTTRKETKITASTKKKKVQNAPEEIETGGIVTPEMNFVTGDGTQADTHPTEAETAAEAEAADEIMPDTAPIDMDEPDDIDPAEDVSEDEEI